MKTFNSFSFGCRVNQAEKEALDRELLEKGYQKNEQDPDIYILNTCSVTHKAEREAKQHIYQIKRQLPDTKLIVTGCAATNWVKTKTQVEGIDYLVDNPSKAYIADLIEQKFTQKNAHISKINLVGTDKFTNSGRIIIKIQDGCNRFCTFCIVPYLRGLPQSVPISDLVKQVNEYKDYKEVILTAINTDAYGYDTKETFADLVRTLLEKTEIPRFSFGSIHPWSINEEFLNLYSEYRDSKRFVHFFHIPLQAGSDNTLRLMKRGYTRGEFIEKLHKIAAINPFAFIGTDVIAGFLEETDKDFEDTYEFLDKTPISKFHVFKFSVRNHTAAFHLSKRLTQPPIDVKYKRAKALRELSEMKYLKFLNRHIDHEFEALFLEKQKEGYQLAVLENQIPIEVEVEKDYCSEIKRVKVISEKNGKLFGKLV